MRPALNKHETPIGMVGLGLLGSAMAHRLVHHGYLMKGYDLDPKRCESFSAIGGQALEKVEQVFEKCEVVLLSLPTSDIVGKLFNQVKPNLRKDQIVVDTTTGNPEQMQAIGKLLENQKLNYVEATVAGSSQQMQSGDAVLFVGGDETIVHTIQPLLEVLSARHFYLGTVGNASRFKLVHNLVLGLHRAVLAEGLSFAESLGFDSQRTLEILQQTPAASDTMATKGQKMVARDWQTHARLSQHLKDVRLILEMAKQTHSLTPFSQLHRELLEQVEQLGYGEADNSAILEVFTKRS